MLAFIRPAILAIALIVLPAAYAVQASAPQSADATTDPHAADEQAAQRQALGFLGYLDQGRYADSYDYTGMLIRNQADRKSFAQQLEKARAGVGALQQRTLSDVSYSTTVPGAPQGQYVVLHYQTSFSKRQDAVETLTLEFAKDYWRLAGYYIR